MKIVYLFIFTVMINTVQISVWADLLSSPESLKHHNEKHTLSCVEKQFDHSYNQQTYAYQTVSYSANDSGDTDHSVQQQALSSFPGGGSSPNIYSMVVNPQNATSFIDTSSIYPVQAVYFQSLKKLLIVVDNHGYVRVWNTQEQKPVSYFHIDYPYKNLEINPYRDQLAVSHFTDHVSTISVYNLDTGMLKFSYQVHDSIIGFCYSQSGNYIIISKLMSPYYIFIDSSLGTMMPYLANVEHSASFTYLGISNSNFMTYDPSGAIYYYGLSSGVQMAYFFTKAHLHHLHVLENVQFMLAQQGPTQFYLINRLNGKISSTLSFTPDSVISTSIDAAHNQIAILNSSRILTIYDIGSGSFLVSQVYNMQNYVSPEQMLLNNNEIYFFDFNGQIRQFDMDTSVMNHFRSTIQAYLLNMFHTSDQVCFTSKKSLLYCLKFSPNAQNLPSLIENFTMQAIPNGQHAQFYQGKYYFYSGKNISCWINKNGHFVHQKDLSWARWPIRYLKFNGDHVLILAKDGHLTLRNIDNNHIVFSYMNPNISAVALDQDNVYWQVINNHAQPMLYQFNLSSQQTIPMLTHGRYFYKMNAFSNPLENQAPVPAEQNGALQGKKTTQKKPQSIASEENVYILGHRQGNTEIYDYYGKNFVSTEPKTLFSIAGIDNHSDFLVDQKNKSLYTSAGHNGLYKISKGGKNIKLMSTPLSKPDKIMFFQHYIISLNQDNSVGVYDLNEQRWVMNVNFLKDGFWVAQDNQGLYSNTQLDGLVYSTYH